jgi:hypothetical protein
MKCLCRIRPTGRVHSKLWRRFGSCQARPTVEQSWLLLDPSISARIVYTSSERNWWYYEVPLELVYAPGSIYRTLVYASRPGSQRCKSHASLQGRRYLWVPNWRVVFEVCMVGEEEEWVLWDSVAMSSSCIS